MATVTWKGRLPGKRQKEKGKEKQRSRGRKATEPTQGCPWNQTNWEFGITPKWEKIPHWREIKQIKNLEKTKNSKTARWGEGEEDPDDGETIRMPDCFTWFTHFTDYFTYFCISHHMTWHLMKLVFREHLDFHISEERGNLIFLRKFESSQEILVRGILSTHQYWHILSWSGQGEAPEEKVDLQFGVLTP